MESKIIRTMFSLLVTIVFATACSLPANSPTPEPQTTEPPTSQATAPATEAPITSDGGMPVTGEGLCANAYYPVRQGATWSYKSAGSSAGEYSFTDTISAVREDGFTLSTQFGDLTRTQEWACQAEGLVALQFGGAPAANLSAQNMELNLEVTNVSGVTFPNEISAGDQWQHNLDLEGKMTIAGQEGTATGNSQTSFTAVGEESVTVPAGTFNAMKIQVDTTMNMNVSYQGLAVPVAFSMTYNYWFVQGVGWVKAAGSGSAAGAAFNETIELQSYSIP